MKSEFSFFSFFPSVLTKDPNLDLNNNKVVLFFLAAKDLKDFQRIPFLCRCVGALFEKEEKGKQRLSMLLVFIGYNLQVYRVNE